MIKKKSIRKDSFYISLALVSLFIALFISYNFAWASANDYKENKAISALLNREGFKFFDTPNEYISAYRLQKQTIYYHEHVNIYNEEETTQTGSMGYEHKTPIKVGAFVVNTEKRDGEPIKVRKAFSISNKLPSQSEALAAFMEKYGLKDKRGNTIPNQLFISVKHKDRYLQITVIVEPIGNGQQVITYDVLDYTKYVRAELEDKNRAKDIFK